MKNEEGNELPLIEDMVKSMLSDEKAMLNLQNLAVAFESKYGGLNVPSEQKVSMWKAWIGWCHTIN